MSQKNLAIVVFLALVLSGCTTYKFGVQESLYPQYFSGDKENKNRVLKLNEEYSWLTKLPLDGETISVEHGVIASQDDIKRLGLPNGNYIFVSIEFQRQNITAVALNLSYSGNKLREVGSYIVKPGRDENCRKDGSNSTWKIIKLNDANISEQCAFGLVKLFHVPEENHIFYLTPKTFWFSKNLMQNIEVTAS